MNKPLLLAIILITGLTSCEEIVEIDLNTANPAFVVEGFISKDLFCFVKLTKTSSYFETEEADTIADAVITLSDGISTETLIYSGNGNYTGKSIIGTEGRTYTLEILHDGKSFVASSFMPPRTILTSTLLYKDETKTIDNPQGEKIITISCSFNDNPDQNNYYLLQFIKDGKLLDDAFYLMTENNSNVGSFTKEENIVNFSESIFYDEEGMINVLLYSVDESIYNYFFQLNDILFWKRRVMPPSPYNPTSNVSNGALGYFAAWAVDLKTVEVKW